MKDFNKLSERQRNILKYMDKYIHENGFPPTIREIGSATGIESTSVVNYNLNKLVDAGFLERSASKSRGLRLVRAIPNSYTSPGPQTRRVRARAEQLSRVALIGRIVAGEPISVPEDHYIDEDQMIALPDEFLGGLNPTDVYALTVSGDSMIDAMIQNGDTVILRRTNVANNGDMVAVWLTDRGETTLKYFYDEGQRIRLQPAHPLMDPIYVDARYCQIQGKVLSVLRRLK
ncbi:MAG: transcriptional repressor LexA [Chloroflexota bacterium]